MKIILTEDGVGLSVVHAIKEISDLLTLITLSCVRSKGWLVFQCL